MINVSESIVVGTANAKLIVSGTESAFDSSMAARRVHFPNTSAQTPSPGIKSSLLAASLTTKVAARASGAANRAAAAKHTAISLARIVVEAGCAIRTKVRGAVQRNQPDNIKGAAKCPL